MTTYKSSVSEGLPPLAVRGRNLVCKLKATCGIRSRFVYLSSLRVYIVAVVYSEPQFSVLRACTVGVLFLSPLSTSLAGYVELRSVPLAVYDHVV